ncbi:AAA ATPase domain-containing protein [Dictyostelium discoideum AX4]|uniref:AAA ATPase domain-containing protein n=1 Tax=Dictyostelium discoideum TaxID=44689 RepID=Q1ZXK7_DICDI|nr:AAA ATPase domain-containing protein [Dictyostelium discoideum AX4]EAS66912.1 AAA ATPase domain-containing protein [Dictyostelium discoideum AX4]|eukprot:XP_001134596.1 AAA ATPase domain-containing protein [Dictyostelium discoideum AX4]
MDQQLKELKQMFFLFGLSMVSYYTYIKLQEYVKRQQRLSIIKDHKNIKEISRMHFNEYEFKILSGLVVPRRDSIRFEDIGGLDLIIEDLKETIFFPMQAASNLPNKAKNGSFHNDLFSVPKGILLYGPPGTGKTMLAKAISYHCGYNFLVIDNSMLDSKWYGETEKMVSAMFSVAKKLQPTIIFIDEIDSMVSTREDSENETSNSKKSILLQHWDGFFSSGNDKVIVMGATNRPNSIDYAFLRRLPKRIKVDLPDKDQRKHILQIMLEYHVENDFDYDKIANLTKGYSGSDLKELCKKASMRFMRYRPKTDNIFDSMKIPYEYFEKVLLG